MAAEAVKPRVENPEKSEDYKCTPICTLEVSEVEGESAKTKTFNVNQHILCLEAHCVRFLPCI